MVTDDLRKTPLHSRHVALGGRLVPFAGFELPIQYSGIAAEHQAVRTRAGIFDVSHMGELRVRGPGAVSFIDSLITNDLSRIAIGQAVYTCCCREDGGILDDLIVYKHGDDDVLVVCNASNHDKIWQHFQTRSHGVDSLALEDQTDSTALLALQGPRALELLGLLEPELRGLSTELSPFRFRQARLTGKAVTIARTGYTGEDGVEIFCGTEDAGTVWDAILRTGTTLGVVPAGLGCRDTLRLEARLSLYGNELDEQTNPLEAGLGWTVKWNKEFEGKRALLAARECGLTRRIAGFEMVGRGSARHGYPLLDLDGAPIGICTSGGPSPTLGKAIGLGFMPVAMTEVGTRFAVDCRGKVIEARVVATPFYRRA